ncbi:hypothetical protein [Gemmata sp.]|uniref:hypothetical protein n=1 Tax=Gemmata sp. TaxID=1914242 RepID=UPI003F72C17E
MTTTAATRRTDGDILLAAVRAEPLDVSRKLAFVDWCGDYPETVSSWLAAAADHEPLLTVDGVGYPVPIPGRSRYRIGRDDTSDRFRIWRDTLFNRPTEFGACVAFLAACTTRRTCDPRANSYSLKHRVERHYEGAYHIYIPNGALIAAALHLGFKCERLPDSLNAVHNISRRSPVLRPPPPQRHEWV